MSRRRLKRRLLFAGILFGLALIALAGMAFRAAEGLLSAARRRVRLLGSAPPATVGASTAGFVQTRR